MKTIPLGCSLLLAGLVSALADPTPPQMFQAMLENVTLNGTWAPVAEGAVGEDRKDGYHIVRAVHRKENRWHIVSRIKHKGKLVDFPIPVEVYFAYDTAVMVLDNVPVGDGSTWSARILFYDAVYTGSWWSPDQKKSGIVSGTITRNE